MHRSQNQHLYELLPSYEDDSKPDTARTFARSLFQVPLKLVAMILTMSFLAIAFALAFT